MCFETNITNYYIVTKYKLYYKYYDGSKVRKLPVVGNQFRKA